MPERSAGAKRRRASFPQNDFAQSLEYPKIKGLDFGVCWKKLEPILRRTLKTNADSAGRNILLGIWIRPASADFPPAGGVWGGMRAGFGLGVFGNSAAIYQILKNILLVLIPA